MVITTGSLAYNNLYRQSHANIYNLINTRSNVADPDDSTGARKFVYVREPKKMSRGFLGYPLIIIPSFSMSQVKASVDTTMAFIMYDLIIRVWTQDKTSDSLGNPAGAEQLDTISEDIVETINANRKDLINYGMAHFEINDSDFDYDDVDGKTIYMREFTMSFKKRLQVTA